MYPLTAGMVVGTTGLLDELRLALEEISVRVVFEKSAIDDLLSFVGELETLRPEVLILDLAVLADSVTKVFREIKSSAAAPAIVALHTSADPETILAAMRAGASEYLYPPFRAKLRPALDRIFAERSEQRQTNSSGGKTLGFFSAKGGCGATTVACHIAVELQRQTSHRILLADFDIETGMVRFFMKSKSDYSVLDAVNNIDKLDFNYWRALISNGMPRLEVIAAPSVSASLEVPDERTFRHVVRFARSQYDWVVVDLGRSLNLLSMCVLEEIDESYLITTLDVPALYQAKHVLRTLLDSGYGRNRLRIVLNRMPKRPEVTVEEVERMLGMSIHSALPNDYPALYEAYAEGGLLPPTSNLGAYFSRLAARIAGIPEQKKKAKFSLFG